MPTMHEDDIAALIARGRRVEENYGLTYPGNEVKALTDALKRVEGERARLEEAIQTFLKNPIATDYNPAYRALLEALHSEGEDKYET